MLLDDNETFIELEEQDYYSFHDASTSARQISVRTNKDHWKRIKENMDGYYPDANTSLGF
jgi:hypothetical protein